MQLSIAARFLDAFLKGFVKTVRDRIIDGLILAFSLIYWLMQGKLFSHLWESIAPWVWALCAIIAWHSLVAARLLLAEVDAESGTKKRGSIIVSEYGKPLKLDSKELAPYRGTIYGIVCCVLLLCCSVGYLTWKAAYRPHEDRVSVDANAASRIERKPMIALYLECDFQNFPMEIPAGTQIVVLQAHPNVIKKHLGLVEIRAPQDKSRTWPTVQEAPPLPRPPVTHSSKPFIGGFRGVKCVLKKYGGNIVLDRVGIRLVFSDWGTYDLYADPFDAQPSSPFSFYMINYCYLPKPAPGGVNLGGGRDALVMGYFSPIATFRIAGESSTRQVGITIPFRDSLQPNFFLFGTYRHWNGFPPC